jgi:hypothetical protein
MRVINATDGVPLMDLEAGRCAWPVTAEKPHRFCGAPALPGRSYCQIHDNLAYRRKPAEPKLEAA